MSAEAFFLEQQTVVEYFSTIFRADAEIEKLVIARFQQMAEQVVQSPRFTTFFGRRKILSVNDFAVDEQHRSSHDFAIQLSHVQFDIFRKIMRQMHNFFHCVHRTDIVTFFQNIFQNFPKIP